MKKIRFLVCMLAMLTVTALLPNTKVFAEKKQKVIQTKISTSNVKKMKNSDNKGAIIGQAQSSDYYAWTQGKKANEYNDAEISSLYVTKDGKSVNSIKLKSVVKEALSPASDDVIRFYHLTCINDTFYVTGAIGTKSDYGNAISSETKTVVHFLVSTKDGEEVSVKEIGAPVMPYSKPELFETTAQAFYDEGWSLYYVKEKYVAVSDVIRESFKDKKCTKSAGYLYYTSSDLDNWDKVKIKPYSKLSKDYDIMTISPAGGDADYMIFKEELDNLYYRVKTTAYLYTYTTDFASYKKLTSLNGKIKCGDKFDVGAWETLTYLRGDGKLAILRDIKYTEDNGDAGLYGRCKKFAVYYSKGMNDFRKMFDFNESFDRYSCSWYAKGINCYFLYGDKGKNKCLYSVDLKKGTCEKYSTSLSAKKMGGYNATKDGWNYSIYDGKYLLATKNNGRTVYQIDMGRKNIGGVACADEKLVLLSDNGYDYCVSISAVQGAVKKK